MCVYTCLVYLNPHTLYIICTCHDLPHANSGNHLGATIMTPSQHSHSLPARQLLLIIHLLPPPPRLPAYPLNVSGSSPSSPTPRMALLLRSNEVHGCRHMLLLQGYSTGHPGSSHPALKPVPWQWLHLMSPCVTRGPRSVHSADSNCHADDLIPGWKSASRIRMHHLLKVGKRASCAAGSLSSFRFLEECRCAPCRCKWGRACSPAQGCRTARGRPSWRLHPMRGGACQTSSSHCCSSQH